MKVNWKQIVKDIDSIINNDWGAELDKTIKFYPQGKPEGENGVEILRYREQ